jgi:phage anti-repressor protein
MSEKMIEYFGYKGTKLHQKELFNRLISENFLDYKNELYFEYDNKKYIEFRKEKEESLTGEYYPVKKIDELYPPALTTRGKTNTKHILVSPKLFKRLLMLCNTEKGKQVRNYYIDLEEAIFLYVLYQAKNNQLKYENDIKNLINKNNTRVSTILLFDKIQAKKYKIGCVYFIKEKDTNNIKIGWCWKLKRRLSSLQVGNSKELILVKYELTQFPFEREQELHKLYQDKSVRGEWYDIPDL